MPPQEAESFLAVGKKGLIEILITHNVAEKFLLKSMFYFGKRKLPPVYGNVMSTFLRFHSGGNSQSRRLIRRHFADVATMAMVI